MSVLPGRMRRTAAAALALAALLVSCSEDAPSREPENPVAGGTLRVSVRELNSLDPAKARGQGAALVLEQVFDSLTGVDDAGNAVPAAAEKWTTSPDGLTWTFTLGRSVFHNGDPVTAYDFKFAFDRIAGKTLASEAAFQLEPVRGFKAVRIDGTTQALSGVEVVNASTLRITLDRPFYELPVYLSHAALGPVSQKLLNRDPAAFAKHPIGNGAFEVAAPMSVAGVRLTRFDGHAGATAYLDALDVVIHEGADDGYRAYLRDEVEIAEVPNSAIESSRGRIGPSGFTPLWAAVYYGPNMRLDKFKNPEFRRAISLAINRATIASSVYGGTKMPATGVIPLGIPGFPPDRCRDCRFNPGSARDLIKAAFPSGPPEVVLDHLAASPSREVAAAIAANLREVGLTVSLRAHESGAYLRLLESGQQELAELGWLAEVPSSDGFLAQQLRSGSPNNQVGFSDSAFDTAIDKARATKGIAERRAQYQSAETRALAEMALIPVVFFRNHLAVARSVRGFDLNGAGLFDASRVWLSTEP
ncbi:MAG TPA: peptide ABC transporter substrate-binding protein [Actinomycetota bacterium]|nr:peptide ABC transporter substrate-binding protein [Actinomycetota bacterium]